VISAVDTSVLIDVLTADPDHGAASRAALADCLLVGKLVISDVAWAEAAAGFGDPAEVRPAIYGLHLELVPMGEAAASAAGSAWRRYRRSGGTRSRMIADFLIGAHALHHADRLVTRDRGFFREYFADLAIVDAVQAESLVPHEDAPPQPLTVDQDAG
jgi:predicted nucleic acid-binding protein